MIDLTRLVQLVAQIDQDRMDLDRRLYQLTEALIEFYASEQYETDLVKLATALKITGGSTRPDRTWRSK